MAEKPDGKRWWIWDVYYDDQEYAKMMGDPCLGQVFGRDLDEARRAAQGMAAPVYEHLVPNRIVWRPGQGQGGRHA